MPKQFDDKLSLEELDRQTVFHASTDLKAHASGVLGTPRIIDSGKGIHIRDNKGNTLLDAFAGLYCVNVGYGRMEIADAIHAQAKSWLTTTPTLAIPARLLSNCQNELSKWLRTA